MQLKGAVATGLGWWNELSYRQLPWVSTELTAKVWFPQEGSLNYGISLYGALSLHLQEILDYISSQWFRYS